MRDNDIKNIQISSLFSLWLMGLFLIVYTGCSGGDWTASTTHKIEGVVQKGLFIDGTITVQEVTEKGEVLATELTTSIDEKGYYHLECKQNALFVLTATGKFFNEYTGQNSEEEAELYALLDLREKDSTGTLNINLFTALESKRVLMLMQQGEGYEEALKKTKASMESTFGLLASVHASDLDIYDINGTLKESNKNLLLFSATLLKIAEETLAKSSNLPQKFSRSMMDRMYSDFSDNGEVDGLFKDEFDVIIKDDEAKTLAIAGSNLGLGEIGVVGNDSPWVVIGGESESSLSISTFDLKSVNVDGVVQNYSAETVAFIGFKNSATSLTFLLESTVTTPTAYHVDIYANAGTQSLKVKSAVGIAENENAKTIEVTVGSELRTFLKEAYANNQEVSFKAISDVLLNRLVYVSKETTAMPKFAALSEQLMVNGIGVEITNASFLGKLKSDCSEEVGIIDASTTQYARLNVDVQWQPSAQWSLIDGNISQGCLKLEYEETMNSFKTVLVDSNIQLSSTQSTFTLGDSVIEMPLNTQSVQTEIKPDGGLMIVSSNGTVAGTLFEVTLSTKQSLHLGVDTVGIIPTSFNKLQLLSQSMNIGSDWEHLRLKSIMTLLGAEYNLYVHGEGLPFYIQLSDEDIILDTEGIYFSNVSAFYMHQAFGEVLSNDIQFSNPTGTFNMHISENGVQTDTPIQFAALSNVQTNFPYSQMSLNGFNINLVDGAIVSTDIAGSGNYTLGYKSACQGIACSDEGTASETAYTFNSSATQMAKDGALKSTLDIRGKTIAWGAQQAGKYTFERASDTQGVMYVPGFEIATHDPDELVNHLMGSRNLDSEERLAEVHPLNSDSFNKAGNGLFAGVNVGALYLESEGENHLTSLEGTSMNLQVGGTTKEELTLNNNGGTKYYVRPSGITGVFNGTLENADVHIYGYPMAFRRFAFAQVANQLDEETWIDGAVTVTEPGGFKVDFSSLALDCTGALNGGLVDESDCEATVPLNCNETLSAWKTNTHFVTVGFEASSDDSCGEKHLKVGHILDIKALKQPLGLTATWLSSGEPSTAVVSGSSANFLDREENNESSDGFAITLDSGSQLTAQGWYKFSGAFGLPFWGMKAVDFGLENSADGSSRMKSAIMEKEHINAAWNSATLAAEAKDKTFMADYQWGSTGLGFELPVKYEAKEANEESLFVGIKKELDLGVMSANAGINYIKPKATKISFGASADFEAMANLQITIDLNDPESLRQIDSTLADPFGITGNPLQSTIGQILQPLHEAEAYADKGVLLGMEEMGVLALEEGVSGIGFDPFEEVSSALVELHALPTRTIEMTEDYLIEKIDGGLSTVSNTINTLLENSSSVEIAEINSSIALLEQANNAFVTLEQLKAQLRDVNRTLEQLSLTAYMSAFDKTVERILPKASECTADSLLAHSELFRPITTVKGNIKTVNDALQGVDISTVRGFASKVEGKIDFDTSDLVDTFEKTQSIARSLNSDIVAVQSSIDGQLTTLCTQSDTIRNSIQSAVVKVDKFDPLKVKLQVYLNSVYALLDAQNITVTQNKISEIKAVLESFRAAQTLDDEQRGILENMQAVALLNQIENVRIDGQSIASIKNEINEAMREIPQPTAEELRYMVVDAILDTSAVESIRIAMNEVISPAMDEVRGVAVDLISSVNRVIYDLFNQLSQKANEVLASATSAVAFLPIKSAKMDGYALISGDELDRLHIGAEWAVDTGKEDTSYTFNGALDMQRWGASGKAGCGGTTSTDGNIDVKISTRDIKMDLGGKALSVDNLYFGFTLANALPMGVMGGIDSKSGFDFNTFKLYDMQLAVGIGAIETYLGAKTAALFEAYQLQVAFLLGKTCGKEILTALDPKVGAFITLPNNVFQGAYIRGGASFPIWNNGCALTVGVSADLGAWVVIPGTYGGLIGGGAYGKALCIAALRGQVETLFEKSGDTVRFIGSGWGAAGVGYCSPSKWTSVAKSRKDSWCGTGDAQFGASYNNGWSLDTPRTSAVH